ncbi:MULTISPECIES: tyrosine-type recombinase/integrase [Aquamicrobium]|uniref:Integrase n=2 Tax=Aquamicrobium TaxID=69278 RepID=A0A011URX8_9HYPH|nr:site-specific integrase [Aquamicrobium defluvii]EXL08628.1 integrase [Aquamicrobium defluvii]EZQ14860.1 integrase [Halopseudomonas bauzanensis]
MPKLTKAIIDRAEPREKQYTIWCSELKGFGAYVHPSGRRTYFIDYRTGDGTRRRMTIGRHGALTTEQARKLAIETMGGVVLRKADPLGERRSRRSSITLSDLCDQYLKVVESGMIVGRSRRPKKASTIEIDRGRIERHIKPLLGAKRVIDLTRADVVKFIRDVTAGRTAVHNRRGKNGARILVTGGPGTAARTAGLLGAILTYAVGEGIIEHNPAASVPKPADNVRTRRLSADEYRAVGKVLSDASAELGTPQALTGAWLLALTGCRLGEIVNLTWDEVDEASNCFRLKDSKTGPSVRPIGKEAFDVLADALRVDGNPYVLPGLRKEGSYNGLSGAWLRFMRQAQLAGVTPHTMRHSYASIAGDIGMSDSTISSLLGHSSATVTSKYVHRLDSVLVASANKVCREIFRQMTGKGGNVIDMPRRA